MKTIAIGFSKPKSKWAFVGKLIMLVQRSKFSHAFLRWHSNSIDRDLVYQASHGMVHFISGNGFDNTNETVVQYIIELSEDQYNAVIQKCVDLAGTKYGYLQLIGMGLERITGLKNPFRDGSNTYVCSELVGEVLKQFNEINIDLEYSGPSELELLVSELPGVIRVTYS